MIINKNEIQTQREIYTISWLINAKKTAERKKTQK